MALKKDRLCMLAGFMPALAMLLLMLAEYLTNRGILAVSFPLYCGLQAVALGLPLSLQYWLNRSCAEKVPDRVLAASASGRCPLSLGFRAPYRRPPLPSIWGRPGSLAWREAPTCRPASA